MAWRRILFVAAAALLAAYGITVGVLARFDTATAPLLPPESPTRRTPLAQAAFRAIARSRCDYCHTEGAKLPFYAGFPVARQLMQRDVLQGLRHFRLEPVLKALRDGTPPPEADLARIEWVTQQRRMPPSPYTLMHLDARATDDGNAALLAWVADSRRRHYATADVAPALAAEPVQPVPAAVVADPDKVELGRRLFFDPGLSGDGTLSCASCHAPDRGGADGLVTATGIRGQKGPINTPTVFNAVFNQVQFWNGRAPTLAAQAAGPVMNPLEMGSRDWNDVGGHLGAQPDYARMFRKVYGPGPVDVARITDAIAAFEATLVTPDSRFDRYLRGDARAIDPREQRGYALFKENACASCHVGRSLGGQSMEIMGLRGDYFAERGGKVTDADLGRFAVTGAARDRHRFKVPNLRNIALTAPYLHDGSARTLADAVRIMVRYQTPAGRLPDRDVDDIVAFLGTLTGSYDGKPLGRTEVPGGERGPAAVTIPRPSPAARASIAAAAAH